MSASEFLTIIGVILVGLLFFAIARNYIFGEGVKTKEYGYKADAQEIIALIEKVSGEPNEFTMYCQDISLCDIEVKGGILTYEKNDFKYSYPISKNLEEVTMEEVTRICVINQNKSVTLHGGSVICILDTRCTPEECLEDCLDCYGPDDVCVGDGYCNPYIGENCRTSPDDCQCDPEKICCPESFDADENGCSETVDIVRGNECWCNEQCEGSLECNPTTDDFSDYANACCESGKGWDGTECKELDVLDFFIIPVGISDPGNYNNIANQFIDHFVATSPFRDCSDIKDRIKFWIIEPSDCPSSAQTSYCDHCSSCINIGRSCARRMESIYGVAFDKFAVLTESGGWNGGCAGNIPNDGSSSSLIPCSLSGNCVPTHETGHTLGLGHVNCGVACHACSYNNPNCPDCDHPDRAEFIMDYCTPMRRFGPEGYNFLKTQYIGTSPHNQGLARWLEGC